MSVPPGVDNNNKKYAIIITLLINTGKDLDTFCFVLAMRVHLFLINIKIKAVMNKNIFDAIFRFISLNHFQAKFFIKYWEKKNPIWLKFVNKIHSKNIIN